MRAPAPARRARPRRLGGDDGVALPLVIGTMAVVSIFLVTALTMAVQDTRPARADQDSKAAVAAAQAGIDEYISRLTADSNYWERGNTDAANPALPNSRPVASRTTAALPGAAATSVRFRYELMTTPAQTAQDGYILLASTGSASAAPGRPVVTRTLTARLQPRGFLRYVYFTDVEALDPELYRNDVWAEVDGSSGRENGRYGYLASPEKVVELCSSYYYLKRRNPKYVASGTSYYYEYDSRRDRYTKISDGSTITFSCNEIQWVTGDLVDGPLHTNDALWVTGAPRFTDEVVGSSWLDGDANRLWRGDGAPVGPTANPPGFRPRKAPPLKPPSQNTALLKHVRPKTDTDPNPNTRAARPGCRYTGATKITFTGTTMTVLSPNTSSSDTPSDCLDVGNRANPQTKPIPPVIYVAPATGSCVSAGYPTPGESTTVGITTDYDPCRANAYVQGLVDAQVTVSAEDDVVVTGDVTVKDRDETDVVGLVAGNNVWVYNPIRSNGRNLLPYRQAVRTIEASILALRHSFIVQNWRHGANLSQSSADSLRVDGSIAQKFRGPVGSVGASGRDDTGYYKDYVYDERLQVLQPPFFLSPDNAPWEAVRITDG